jgi:hypothetical protein
MLESSSQCPQQNINDPIVLKLDETNEPFPLSISKGLCRKYMEILLVFRKD